MNGRVSTERANPPLQPTAARTRSLIFKRLFPARSRQLNGNPLGGWAAWPLVLFLFRESIPDVCARCVWLVMPVPVVLAWFDRPSYGSLVVRGVIVCCVWFCQTPVVPAWFRAGVVRSCRQ